MQGIHSVKWRSKGEARGWRGGTQHLPLVALRGMGCFYVADVSGMGVWGRAMHACGGMVGR